METKSTITSKAVPITKPETKSKPPSRTRPQVKKTLTLPIPEELLILTIDDEGVISAPMKTNLQVGLAGAFLAELVLAKKIHLAEDRLTISSTAPTGDTLFDDILAMLSAEKKPRKLGHWVQAIGSKLTIKQVALRLVERKVIVLEKKHYAWVIPYPTLPQGAGFGQISAQAAFAWDCPGRGASQPGRYCPAQFAQGLPAAAPGVHPG